MLLIAKLTAIAIGNQTVYLLSKSDFFQNYVLIKLFEKYSNQFRRFSILSYLKLWIFNSIPIIFTLLQNNQANIDIRTQKKTCPHIQTNLLFLHAFKYSYSCRIVSVQHKQERNKQIYIQSKYIHSWRRRAKVMKNTKCIRKECILLTKRLLHA